MDFDALVAAMDDALVSIFQKIDPAAGVLQVTLHSGSGVVETWDQIAGTWDEIPGTFDQAGRAAAAVDITVPCIVKNPIMEEDYMPGSQKGASMLILFIPASAGVVALRGQTATYNGVDYDILQSDADRCGGVHIRLRARTQAYTQ